MADTVASDHNRQWADGMYHMALALLCDVGLSKGAAGQSRCSIMHCIASHRCLPPPLIPPFLHSVCSTLRSSAVVAGLELQVLVPSGPAPGPDAAAAPTGPLSSQPGPAHPLPFSKIHARGQISSAYALASHMFYETRPGPPWLSMSRAEHSTAQHSTTRATAWQG